MKPECNPFPFPEQQPQRYIRALMRAVPILHYSRHGSLNEMGGGVDKAALILSLR